uniref:Uncharacterized protein n=1 Tax=Pseudomonas fluorescens (strain SBW25) TaxID=216595 RepID=A0A0G4E559_PSEFS|nr:hypothetical protein [Pseudomonas fluorescens]CEK42138.1 hypothetical protein PQBR57_0185 [Pseudomonas fluorescens SBW25]
MVNSTEVDAVTHWDGRLVVKASSWVAAVVGFVKTEAIPGRPIEKWSYGTSADLGNSVQGKSIL